MAKASVLLLPSAVQKKGAPHPLQPGYFISSLFVDPLRQDIDALLKAYIERCKAAHQLSEDIRPFIWFKAIWKEQKWHLFHLRCVEARARQAFLETTFRLFMERAVPPDEPVLNRVVALFAIFTLFKTQSKAHGIHSLPYICIAVDHYHDLVSMPAYLPPTFDYYAAHIILQLASPSNPAFVLIPPSSTHPYTPSVLPLTTVALVPETTSAVSKLGRPTAANIERRTIRAISRLNSWALEHNSAILPPDAAPETEQAYNQAKLNLTQTLSLQPSPNSINPSAVLSDSTALSVLKSAEQSTLLKMHELDQAYRSGGFSLLGPGAEVERTPEGAPAGIAMVETAIRTERGLLGLTSLMNESPEGSSRTS